MILLGQWPSFMKLVISATFVIRKWSHAISKYNEAAPGAFFFPK
jgi:hypothetical protein